MNVAINGFGRIGRNVLRILEDIDGIDVVAINDLTDEKTLAHLLKYDSVHGTFAAEVEAGDGLLKVAGRPIAVYSEPSPEELPWADLNVDVVVEATGRFTTREGASKHIAAGAQRVVISAPGKGVDATIVMGVNETVYDPARHQIVSNASCTTNCLAPVAKVLLAEFGIVKGLMTTIHAFTNDQKILDLPHKDLRRARAASMSMIPTTTGAAKAVAEVLPSLQGKLDGMAVRVPVPNVSLVDLVVEVEEDVTVESVNKALELAAQGPLAGIMDASSEPLVSIDYNGSSVSSTVDLLSTKVIGDRMVKILAWYDNEWGYSCRVCDLIALMSKAG